MGGIFIFNVSFCKYYFIKFFYEMKVVLNVVLVFFWFFVDIEIVDVFYRFVKLEMFIWIN